MAAVVVAAVSLGALTVARRGSTARAARTVVVVPFDNIGDPADAYFADGVSEEIAGQLARLPGLQVIGRDGVQRFRGSGRTPRDIAGELGAAYVLSGSVNWARGGARTAGIDGDTRVRIVPALMDVATGTQMWREPFEEPLSDVFKVQANVAERVASALSVTLGGAVRQVLRHQESNDAEARDAQLLGRYFLRQRGLENLRRAEAAFGRAIARDSSYARAWAGLSEATALRPAYYDTTEVIDAVLERAERAAQRAVALDSTLPEVQLALARTRSAQFRFREALQAVDRALALDPNATLTHALRYEVLTALGRSDEAGAAARRAVELDGLSALALNNRAVWFWSAGMMDSAAHYSERAVAVAPSEAQWRRTLATIYASAGRLGEAIPMCETYMGAVNRCAGTLSVLAGVSGNGDEALATLGALGRLAGSAGIPTFAALGYARLGMADSVFSRLRVAVERHDDVFTHLITNRAFDPFQSDPRWDEIVGAVRRR
jgi:serine/threonine-protein kinase